MSGDPGRPDLVTYRPIGVVHSGHRDPAATPIQPVFAKGCEGRVEVFQEFAEGLRDLEGFSHIYLIYHFHQTGPARLTLKPLVGDVEYGVFAMRAPCRPNPVGLSVVELHRREGNILHVSGVDILDGTPLLDIKPYTARFDRIETTRNGWQDSVDWTNTAGKRGFGGP